MPANFYVPIYINFKLSFLLGYTIQAKKMPVCIVHVRMVGAWV